MKVYLSLLIAFFAGKAFGQSFTESMLPIMVIETHGEIIEDDPKVMVDMGLIDNGPGQVNRVTDPFNGYEGKMGIEFRGNSTQGSDKKTYGIELWTTAGADTSTSLLGMPPEEDWILHASQFDKSFLRNYLSFRFWRSLGYWSSRTRYFELVMDGEYQGLYILMEKAKRGGGRLDIARLKDTDVFGDELSGGYIIRMDWIETDGWESNYNSMDGDPLFLQYYYPKASRIVPEQAEYIKNYIDSFEQAIFDPSFHHPSGPRYNTFIDIGTFVHLFIINELSQSVDAYKLSSFIHKEKRSNGGLLKAGPIWDFDLAYYNASYCYGAETAGWNWHQVAVECDDLYLMPMWWERFLQDTLFTNMVKCEWEALRTWALHLDTLTAVIDRVVDTIDHAQQRNFERWDVLGDELFAEPEPIPETYAEEIDRLKWWLGERIAWLDQNMPGICHSTATKDPQPNHRFSMFPNPASQQVRVEWRNTDRFQLQLYTVAGIKIVDLQLISPARFNVSTLEPGIYLVRLISNEETLETKLLIE